MTSVDVSDSVWERFTDIVKRCDFTRLLQKLAVPSDQFLKGPSFFKHSTKIVKEALKNRTLECDDEPVQLTPEWINDAIAISDHLGLDAYQAYLILEMLHGDKVDTSTDLLEKAKELYLAERCAQLICISAVFEKRLKNGNVADHNVNQTIQTFQSSGLFTNLLQECINQLKTTSEGKPFQPLTMGEKELHMLVDLVSMTFRIKAITPAWLGKLCNAIRSVSNSNGIASDLSAKLTLMPMLAFGFWSVLGLGYDERHAIESSESELNKIFCEWINDGHSSQNGVIRAYWSLFGMVMKCLREDSSARHPMNANSVHSLPSMIYSMMDLLKGTSNESFYKECLVMLIDASLYDPMFLVEKTHAKKIFKLISDLCYEDVVLSKLVFCCKTHHRIMNLMNNALDWMSVYPEPILMLLKGFCFPEFATCLSAWVESSYFGVVIVHTPEELAHGNVEMTSHQREEVKSKSVTLPTLGSQIPIPKDTYGQIWHGSYLPWFHPAVPNAVYIKWNAYSFAALFVFIFQRCVSQLRAFTGQANPSLISDAIFMMDFGIVYFEKPPGSNFQFRGLRVVNDVAFLIDKCLPSNQGIYQCLKFMKILCRHDPIEALRAIQNTITLGGGRNHPPPSLSNMLSISEHWNSKRLEATEGTISLFAEYIKQGFRSEDVTHWIEEICNGFLPSMKRTSDPTLDNAKAALYCSILELFHAILNPGIEADALKMKLLDEITIHYCLEDCVDGCLKLLPFETSPLTSNQKRLIANLCEFLVLILKDLDDPNPNLLSKTLRFLMTRGYWNTQTPAMRLSSFGLCAFQKSNEPLEIELDTTVQVFNFLAALLFQYENNRSVLDFPFARALPPSGSEILPKLRKALILIEFSRGRVLHTRLIEAAFEILMVAAKTNSDFLGFMIYPSSLLPEEQNVEPSMLDVIWRFVSDHSRGWVFQPTTLCMAMRALRSLQDTNAKQGRPAWTILKGQTDFYASLIDIVLHPGTNVRARGSPLDVSREAQIEEQIQALGCQVLAHEAECHPINPILETELQELMNYDDKWEEWKAAFLHAANCNPSKEEAKRLVLLANWAAYQMSSELLFNRYPGIENTIQGLDELQRVISETLSANHVSIDEVITYIGIATKGMESEVQLMNILSFAASPFAFLTFDLAAGYLLLRKLVCFVQAWKIEAVELIQSRETELKHQMPNRLKADCSCFALLVETLEMYIRRRMVIPSIHVPFLNAWRRLTLAKLSTEDVGDSIVEDTLKEMIPIGIQCFSQAMYHCIEIFIEFTKIDEGKNPFLLLLPRDLFWCFQYAAELSTIVLEFIQKRQKHIAEPLMRTESEPLRRSSSPDPAFFDLPTDNLIKTLGDWFATFLILETTSFPEGCITILQKTMTNCIDLTVMMMPFVSMREEDGQQWMQSALACFVKCCHPKLLDFSFANASFEGLEKLMSTMEEWNNETLKTFQGNLNFEELFHDAMVYVRRLSFDSKDPERDREIRLWSKNLLRLGFNFLKHPHLAMSLLNDSVQKGIWTYARALFHSRGADLACQDEELFTIFVEDGIEAFESTSSVIEYHHDVHLRKAYRNDGISNPAFEQWCRLLMLVGEMVRHEEAHGMFVQMSGFVFASFPLYIRLPFGTFQEPLTLPRIYRMEANLFFLVSGHEAFASSVGLVSHYHRRRNDVLKFLSHCDGYLRRPDSGLICPPISASEKAADDKTIRFDCDLGWFKICKTGSRQEFFPTDDAIAKQQQRQSTQSLSLFQALEPEPVQKLTWYSWKCAVGLYHCVQLALEFIHKSMPLNTTLDKVSKTQTSWKEIIERIQSDVSALGEFFMNRDFQNDPEMKDEIITVFRILVRIFSLANGFLSENRGRQVYQDRMTSHLESLQKFLTDQ